LAFACSKLLEGFTVFECSPLVLVGYVRNCVSGHAYWETARVSSGAHRFAVDVLLWKESDSRPRRLPSKFSVGEPTTLYTYSIEISTEKCQGANAVRTHNRVAVGSSICFAACCSTITLHDYKFKLEGTGGSGSSC